jgi:hypothetical protein
VGSVQLRDFAHELLHCEHEEHAKAGADLCCLAPATIDIERYFLAGDLRRSSLQLLRGSLPADLYRVGMHRAAAVFFLGDERRADAHAHDGEMLLKAFTAHKNYPDVEIYMTLLAPESLLAVSREGGSRKPAISLCTTTLKTGLLALSTFCPVGGDGVGGGRKEREEEGKGRRREQGGGGKEGGG